MHDSDFPVAIREWPLHEKDITEEVCQKCGICCSMDLKPSWKDPRMMAALRVMIEGYDNITFTGDGIRIHCSHLKETKMEWKSMKCDIYDDRPQLCRDFNCVSWAKVSNNLEQYNRVLHKIGLTPVTFRDFPEELRGPDT